MLGPFAGEGRGCGAGQGLRAALPGSGHPARPCIQKNERLIAESIRLGDCSSRRCLLLLTTDVLPRAVVSLKRGNSSGRAAGAPGANS